MPRYPYDRRYTPPAPVLPVRVGRPGTTPEVFLSALVDTGADISVLPEGLPGRLGLPAVDRVSVAGIGGLPHSLPVYAAEVAVNGFRKVIRAVSLGATPLIGRDLLNSLTVRLHGPEAILDVDLPAAATRPT
jgi:predicted aspartyl protease